MQSNRIQFRSSNLLGRRAQNIDGEIFNKDSTIKGILDYITRDKHITPEEWLKVIASATQGIPFDNVKQQIPTITHGQDFAQNYHNLTNLVKNEKSKWFGGRAVTDSMLYLLVCCYTKQHGRSGYISEEGPGTHDYKLKVNQFLSWLEGKTTIRRTDISRSKLEHTYCNSRNSFWVCFNSRVFNLINDHHYESIQVKNRFYENVPTDEGLYTGYMENEQFHGTGRLVNTNNALPNEEYTGEFKQGKFHGRGKLVENKANGDSVIYTGEFKQGKFHGVGELIENKANGDSVKFVGTFQDGLRNGAAKVVYTYANGNSEISMQGDYNLYTYNQADTFSMITSGTIIYPGGNPNEVYFNLKPEDHYRDLTLEKGIISQFLESPNLQNKNKVQFLYNFIIEQVPGVNHASDKKLDDVLYENVAIYKDLKENIQKYAELKNISQFKFAQNYKNFVEEVFQNNDDVILAFDGSKLEIHNATTILPLIMENMITQLAKDDMEGDPDYLKKLCPLKYSAYTRERLNVVGKSRSQEYISQYGFSNPTEDIADQAIAENKSPDIILNDIRNNGIRANIFDLIKDHNNSSSNQRLIITATGIVLQTPEQRTIIASLSKNQYLYILKSIIKKNHKGDSRIIEIDSNINRFASNDNNIKQQAISYINAMKESINKDIQKSIDQFNNLQSKLALIETDQNKLNEISVKGFSPKDNDKYITFEFDSQARIDLHKVAAQNVDEMAKYMKIRQKLEDLKVSTEKELQLYKGDQNLQMNEVYLSYIECKVNLFKEKNR